MSDRLAFLLGKDPAVERGGDITMFEALRSIAAEHYNVEVICLAETAAESSGNEGKTVRVVKPPVNRARLAIQSRMSGRSLVHTRFDVDGLRDAVLQSTADRFVAVHPYMAEAYLRADAAAPGGDLLVSMEVSESMVWNDSRPRWLRFEAARIARDELRIARAARAIASYDLRDLGAGGTTDIGAGSAWWLPLTLPPRAQVAVADAPPRLVFLGNRSWGPNAEAAATLTAMWPEISRGVKGAELVLVGQPAGHRGDLPEGLIDLGQVDDVAPVLASCRALVAPIAVGGGVRVKVLEAASRGLPVVLTAAGVGPVEASLGITAADGRAEFVARCQRYLRDSAAASDDGDELYRANAQRWSDGIGQQAVMSWLNA